jgi:hypothetical protein
LQDFNSLSDTHFSIVTPALNLKVGAQVVVFGIPFLKKSSLLFPPPLSLYSIF